MATLYCRCIAPMFGCLLVIAAPAFAQPENPLIRLYDVDFGTPPHTVGSPPVAGAGMFPRDTVSSVNFGIPTVVSAFEALTNQPLLFDESFDQIRFNVDSLFPREFFSFCVQSKILISESRGRDRLL